MRRSGSTGGWTRRSCAFDGSQFAEYIDWRAEHPSDDLMTQLLDAEFDDETGTRRRLTRDEVLTYVMLLAGAGNETTTRLIGWTGKLLAEHPDERRALVEDRSLVPNAIEEILRYEAPSPVQARTMTRDMDHHGQTVSAGSIMVLLNGSANRDDREFPDADRFDVHREIAHHLSFGYGIHFCLGAALAAPRGPGRPRRGPEAVPGMGRRLGRREDGAHADGSRLGPLAGRHRLSARRPTLRTHAEHAHDHEAARVDSEQPGEEPDLANRRQQSRLYRLE